LSGKGLIWRKRTAISTLIIPDSPILKVAIETLTEKKFGKLCLFFLYWLIPKAIYKHRAEPPEPET
jgi:hypothetical protein